MGPGVLGLASEMDAFGSKKAIKPNVLVWYILYLSIPTQYCKMVSGHCTCSNACP